MIRLAPFLVLAALATAPTAQTSFSTDPGLYLVVDNLDPVAIGDDQVGVDAEAGWRYASGLDAGISVRFGRTDFARRFDTDAFGATRDVGVGVAFGYTAPLGDRAGLRIETRGGLSRTTLDRVPSQLSQVCGVGWSESNSFVDNAGEVSAVVGTFRRVPVGRVALQPTVFAGASGTVGARTSPGRAFTLRADADRGSRADGRARLGVALPVTARVLGRLVTVEGRVSVDTDGEPTSLLRLRLN